MSCNIYYVNPKVLLLVLSSLIVANSAVRAETLVTTNGEVFRLNISTGQVAMVSHYFSSDVGSDYPFIIAKGETNLFPLYVNYGTRQLQVALAGPMEIIRTNVGSRAISYQLFTGNSISSEIITATATNTINVPSGKTIKFFQPFPAYGSEISINIAIQKNGRVASGLPIYGGEEFEGPLSINIYFKFPQFDSGKAAVYSYYFTEHAVVVPEPPLILGPTGNFQVGVDKSLDLTNWNPVILHNTANDQKAFYRLRISR